MNGLNVFAKLKLAINRGAASKSYFQTSTKFAIIIIVFNL